jgi:hypothetical protein
MIRYEREKQLLSWIAGEKCSTVFFRGRPCFSGITFCKVANDGRGGSWLL